MNNENNQANQVISITMTSGMDVLAELIESQEDGLLVRNPQMYVSTTNQFIPFVITANIPNREMLIPTHAIVLAAEPLPAFIHAYSDMFMQPEVEESDEPTTELAKSMKRQNDILECTSPVHGGEKSEGGIILR